MIEAEWLACEYPHLMLDFLDRTPSRRRCGLFVAACCRMVFHWLVDNRSRLAVEVVEAFADGLKTENDLNEAFKKASAVYDAIAGSPALAVVMATKHSPDYSRCKYVSGKVMASFGDGYTADWKEALRHQVVLLRDIFGNPFRPVTFSPSWRTDTAVSLAHQMYESREFSAMPILADALQDAGCDATQLLDHLRDTNATHTRGCWALDLVLGKQ